MGTNRLVYQNWIVELGIDPENKDALKDGSSRNQYEISLEDIKDGFLPDGSVPPRDEKEALRQARRRSFIGEQVAWALDKLTADEKEFVERFYYSGQGYREISEKSGRAVYKLEALHKRAVRKLKRELAPVVKQLYNLDIVPPETSATITCPICNSPSRKDIDKLIAGRDEKGTWRPIIKILKDKYGLKIKTPQVLIGHEKYH
ncbi:MAG: sigma-70 family RNA polymerase sigma factor [candidate division Zixibacteria bacterium]|nr:sigma-70 family RNA polymerase sigma factor [candidate division Zixibacteria bacterium]